MVSFADLGLKRNIIEVLESLEFTKPMEVQEQVIPLILQNKNIVFTSRTGSGKTLAYTIASIGRLNSRQGIQMLVILPTRELCIQVGKEVKKICDLLNMKVGILYGGREIYGDRRTTGRKNQIIVATPGRLIQHINEKSVKVGEVKFIVFDESDQLFDDGFYDECGYIQSRISRDAQTILASATITGKVQSFIDREIGEYELLAVGEKIPTKIKQEHIFCGILEKNEALLKFLKKKKFKQAMIFCNTKIKTDNIAKFLKDNGVDAKPLHGSIEQKEREGRLRAFRKERTKMLVTTDVAARGLHIDSVDVVVNYDVPNRNEFYIHRIGRTGRKDLAGYSLTIICEEDRDRFKEIQQEYGIKSKEIIIK